MPVFEHPGLRIDTDRMEAHYAGRFFNAAGTLGDDGALLPIPRGDFRALDFSGIECAALFEYETYLAIDLQRGPQVIMLHVVYSPDGGARVTAPPRR